MIKLAISGCSGRMGKAVVQAALNDESVQIVAGTVSKQSLSLTTDIGILAGVGHLNLMPVSHIAQAASFDILIDFTHPQSTLENLSFCLQQQKKLIIGTTGFTAEQEQLIKKASQDIAIVYSPNMSLGVNLCFYLLAQAAKALGKKADIEIIEAHHRHKIDAPSGTALKMGEIISETLGYNLSDAAVYSRQGETGPRQNQTIGFSCIRAGDIVGDHTVLFALDGERVEITHRASSRQAFAAGAIQAAKWLSQQPSGLYTMGNVLGIG